jgi:hypothetical protein
VSRLCPPVFIRLVAASVAAGLLGLASPPAAAQTFRGFTKTAVAYASGEERNRQTDLRVMEVQFKPMRMLWVEITEPRTGRKQRKEVWYLVYRCLSRPAEGRADETDTRPVNVLDAAPKPVLFMPEAVLITYDDPAQTIPLETHDDQILPEALAAIRAVEERPAVMFARRRIEDSLSVIQPFPDPTPFETLPEDEDWIYGVFLWTDIDPETDFFQVTMRGFSSAYDASQSGPDGNVHPWRKVIVQKFTRRGDRFDPTQREFEFEGDPDWAYQPDETQWSRWTAVE